MYKKIFLIIAASLSLMTSCQNGPTSESSSSDKSQEIPVDHSIQADELFSQSEDTYLVAFESKDGHDEFENAILKENSFKLYTISKDEEKKLPYNRRGYAYLVISIIAHSDSGPIRADRKILFRSTVFEDSKTIVEKYDYCINYGEPANEFSHSYYQVGVRSERTPFAFFVRDGSFEESINCDDLNYYIYRTELGLDVSTIDVSLSLDNIGILFQYGQSGESLSISGIEFDPALIGASESEHDGSQSFSIANGDSEKTKAIYFAIPKRHYTKGDCFGLNFWFNIKMTADSKVTYTQKAISLFYPSK